ncbi:hypothetical protein C2S53_002341 [Perilla frutescens var. hirtella]|uniref:Uncharacterized protein n=1 Tax=Perilla frutescens var. hirtella TaxID=608512 RepID=A0AAD4P3D5_PERFH|nr:hypothetical protein C2S53_002341 [Perilla frutescens var. hirtella]
MSLVDMEDSITKRGHKRHGDQIITNLRYYRVDIFNQVVDLIIQEMGNRFSEVSTELLGCIACLDPRNSFVQFNIDRLTRLADLDPKDFLQSDYLYLPQQLSNFIANVRYDSQFYAITNLGSLAREMVRTDKHSVFPLIYRMIELALVLPVATASVEC